MNDLLYHVLMKGCSLGCIPDFRTSPPFVLLLKETSSVSAYIATFVLPTGGQAPSFLPVSVHYGSAPSKVWKPGGCVDSPGDYLGFHVAEHRTSFSASFAACRQRS